MTLLIFRAEKKFRVSARKRFSKPAKPCSHSPGEFLLIIKDFFELYFQRNSWAIFSKDS
jgi:hypothetical protein